MDKSNWYQLLSYKTLGPTTDKDKADMFHILYAHAVGCLIYVMVCTRPDITQAFRVISKYMSNVRKTWNAIK